MAKKPVTPVTPPKVVTRTLDVKNKSGTVFNVTKEYYERNKNSLTRA